uniref:Ran gtpase-activating protein n=1 Tax=Echinostoma caproni TaxID=27848 RepID=A0A183A5Z9_9TREM
LSGNTLGITAAEPIGIALENNPKLQRCLWSDLFTGRLKSEIAPALRHLSSGIIASGARLVELDLSDNAFGPNGVVGVVDLIASPACSTLQILRMNNQGLGHEGCRHLTEALQKGRKSSGGRGLLLKVFCAGRNRLENYGAQLLSDVFCDMGSLEEVALYQNGIGIHGIEGVDALVRMMKHNPNLRVLNLSDNSLTQKGGKAIAKALSSLENLEELHLSDCILRPSGVTAIARALEDPDTLPNIRVLNLTGNEITRSTGISLILSLGSKSRLEFLDLNANEFGKSGIRAIIRTLASVGLLHVLPVNQADTSSEPVGDVDGEQGTSRFASAFDEDQGSGDEEEEDAEPEDEEDQEHDEDAYGDGDADDYDEYEDEEEEPSYEDADADDKEASFITVEERPIVKPNFSFRALEAAIGDACSPTMKGEVTPSAKPGPFGRGLFSALGPSPVDSTDAASMRSKLWPTSSSGTASGLFSMPTTGMVFGKGQHLFSPPVPSVQQASSNKPEQQATNGDVLTPCILNTQSPVVVPLDKLRSTTKTIEPEEVVRLSLHLCRLNVDTTSTSTPNGAQRLAVDLLASVLTPDVENSDAAKQQTMGSNMPHTSRSSRAANCLLVHLGAIKAEKHSEDYEQVRQLDANAWEHRRVAYLSALRRLVEHYGDQLSTSASACNSIRFLLAQQSEERRTTAKNPNKSDLLSDDLVALLEKELSRIQIA